MTSAIRPFEAFAIRYAQNLVQRSPDNFLGGDPHDIPMPLDYFIWVLRRGDQAFIIDTGFDDAIARKRNRNHLGGLEAALGSLDLRPAEIRDVIITHLHYDHCGNHDLFPNARFHLQDDEIAFATGRCMCHAQMRVPFEVDDVVAMVRKIYEGRVRFHRGVTEIEPGLELHKIGGHTGGLQVVRVFTRRGWMVIASDASHFYANMEEARPFPIMLNVADMLEGHRTCYALADGAQNVIPGHDPLVTARYPSISANMHGRVLRLDADPR